MRDSIRLQGRRQVTRRPDTLLHRRFELTKSQDSRKVDYFAACSARLALFQDGTVIRTG